ncbi:MAG: ACT domain-containing protein [Candidatus Limnocylindrales bacterium]
MATDLTVGLVNRPGTLLRASDALGRAGINIEGACGYVADHQGVYHVLVVEAERARRALLDAGLEIQAERPVVVTAVENRPGSAASVLRSVAAAGVEIDLLYMTADGRLVLGGPDVPAIRKALV